MLMIRTSQIELREKCEKCVSANRSRISPRLLGSGTTRDECPVWLIAYHVIRNPPRIDGAALHHQGTENARRLFYLQIAEKSIRFRKLIGFKQRGRRQKYRKLHHVLVVFNKTNIFNTIQKMISITKQHKNIFST